MIVGMVMARWKQHSVGGERRRRCNGRGLVGGWSRTASDALLGVLRVMSRCVQVCVCMFAYVCAVRVCAGACLCASVCAVRVCNRVCKCVCVRVCIICCA